jgi:hypothetical protein
VRFNNFSINEGAPYPADDHRGGKQSFMPKAALLGNELWAHI